MKESCKCFGFCKDEVKSLEKVHHLCQNAWTQRQWYMKKYWYFNSRDEFYKIDVSQIVNFEADGNYTNFFFYNKLKGLFWWTFRRCKPCLSKTWKKVPPLLPVIGKRFIININFVYHIEVLRQKLTLSDDEGFAYQLSVSKEALKKLKDMYVASAINAKSKSL